MGQAMDAVAVSGGSAGVSKGRKVTGWVVTVLIAAFMLLDAAMKLVKPAPVIQAFARTGWPVALSVPLGVILLVSTMLYLIPRTEILGAILLTGYLGGAVATNMRLENPLFSHTLFPVYFGVMVWGALWLRDRKVEGLIPLRNDQ